jgi:hypothetical protein
MPRRGGGFSLLFPRRDAGHGDADILVVTEVGCPISNQLFNSEDLAV